MLFICSILRHKKVLLGHISYRNDCRMYGEAKKHGFSNKILFQKKR
uniref:Uncharacterized protein n=1 Tax=Arundo donax TaxID=35708 RepID=A0A0A9AL46_ARUDO